LNTVGWTQLKALREPFNDALNYRSRAEKDFFSRLFLRTEKLDRCLLPSTYYLIGEKGTGKTAYAVYIENNAPAGARAQVITMTETQYSRFMELKRRGKLAYSDYSNIWRSMLLFLTGRMMVNKSKGVIQAVTGKFRAVEVEIAKWSQNALNPEIESAFEAITSATISASAGTNNVAAVAGELKEQAAEKVTQIRHHLLDSETTFKDAIASLKLQHNHILFIDGLDYRPDAVPYTEYLECLKGLAEATWQLNIEFFNQIRDSKGRLKIVLLVRPDVFHSLNVYNANSRLQDNSVFLDWSTTKRDYQSSDLYALVGKYFATQQAFDVSPAAAWEHYTGDGQAQGAVFKRLLELTFQKPRDVLTFIKYARELELGFGHGSSTSFATNLVNSAEFTRRFSDYLLGEAANYANFYMSRQDFDLYMKFFQFLNGRRRFNFDQFKVAFDAFRAWAWQQQFTNRLFLEDPEGFLQLLYDVNIVGYSEVVDDARDETFHFWSYRERSANSVAPKVKTSGSLLVNGGIGKALEVGRAFRAGV
jgi:hypothetical protein